MKQRNIRELLPKRTPGRRVLHVFVSSVREEYGDDIVIDFHLLLKWKR